MASTAKDKTYNGHKNWNHWNVSATIGNNESLYLLAVNCLKGAKNLDHATVRFLARIYPTERTPDGARYSKVAVRAALEGLKEDLK